MLVKKTIGRKNAIKEVKEAVIKASLLLFVNKRLPDIRVYQRFHGYLSGG